MSSWGVTADKLMVTLRFSETQCCLTKKMPSLALCILVGIFVTKASDIDIILWGMSLQEIKLWVRGHPFNNVCNLEWIVKQINMSRYPQDHISNFGFVIDYIKTKLQLILDPLISQVNVQGSCKHLNYYLSKWIKHINQKKQQSMAKLTPFLSYIISWSTINRNV